MVLKGKIMAKSSFITARYFSAKNALQLILVGRQSPKRGFNELYHPLIWDAFKSANFRLATSCRGVTILIESCTFTSDYCASSH